MGVSQARPQDADDQLYLDINFWEYPVWLPHRPPPQEYRIKGFHIAQLAEDYVLPGIADHRLWLALIERAKQQNGVVCRFESGQDLLNALGLKREWDKAEFDQVHHRLQTLHGTCVSWQGTFYSNREKREVKYNFQRLYLISAFSHTRGMRGEFELEAQIPGQLLSSTTTTPMPVALIQSLSPFALRLLEIVHKFVVLRATWTVSVEKLRLKTGHVNMPDGKYARRVLEAVEEINTALDVDQYCAIRSTRRHLTFAGSGLAKNTAW